jgi:hypothetical protein
MVGRACQNTMTQFLRLGQTVRLLKFERPASAARVGLRTTVVSLLVPGGLWQGEAFGPGEVFKCLDQAGGSRVFMLFR